MNLDAAEVVVGIVGVIVGWFCHVGFDAFLDWWFDVTDAATSLMWDLMAIVGIVTVIAVVAGVVWLTNR